ncbi:MAG: bifunctional phosphopantothenoylcysteine decarboxylase/phosphopantothenate--cysteine ligase CoaBC [Pseudomonadota bacterium]
MELQGKRIVLGVTGGVACYKAAELVRMLGKQGASVQVAMTEAATHFVGAATFQALSGKPVLIDAWDTRVANNMAHIELSRAADVLLIAPASADFLAKLAHGLADDLLSTAVLARDCPLIVAPAMNRQMWENAATQRNIATLRQDGVQVIGPDSGVQACGETGLGRMLEAADIVSELIAHFQRKVLVGKRVLLTAGPTFEALDPVRGLSNLSTGKMGYALARAAREAGAEVHLVSGPVALACPLGVTRSEVVSAQQMHSAVQEQLAARHYDVFIAVAAVADYRPATQHAEKIKKSSNTQNGASQTDNKAKPLQLTLVENPDILAEVAALAQPPLCVGFAAESEHLAEYAEAKRQRKNIPLIVGNLIAQGLGGDHSSLTLFDAAGIHPLAPAAKIELARQLIAHIAALLEKN